MQQTHKHIISTMLFVGLLLLSCQDKQQHMHTNHKTAAQILGNPEYLAISYGGYRELERSQQPSVDNIKSDLKILSSMGIKILRTYNLQFDHSPNVLKAIQSLKEEDPNFEMYVMLGAWIDCQNAWTAQPNHDFEDEINNSSEIEKAVQLANQYPDIVKIIAVGNEAMVHWAWSYFVKPSVILKWVQHLQDLKQQNKLPKDLWITSSDNFASWGGGDKSYHNKDLETLIQAVDYVSMHTYPFHDTHHNSDFWLTPKDTEDKLSDLDQVRQAVQRAQDYAKSQYDNVKAYIDSLGLEKPIHIGETGWATISQGLFGINGTHAADEYKQALYYNGIREWTKKENITCFYFEAFDEYWKDPNHLNGSENHFGLFTINGQAKYALWNLVDQGVFKGLSRFQSPVSKTFDGNKEALLKTVLTPPISQTNNNQKIIQ